MSENGKREPDKPGDRDLWLGFDLGATKMLACVCDDDFRIVGRKRKATKGHEGSEAGIDRVRQVIELALQDAQVGAERLAGIGIGIPGPVDTQAGVVLETPNLGWKDLPLQEILEEEYGCPAVVLNDVDAGVYGEYRMGAARDARCVIGLFPGTGIGGGCVYHGEILTGDRISCFEVGHMRVQPEGPLCGCGQHGCLEAVASRLAISSAAARAAYQGNAPHLKKVAGTDLSEMRSGALAESIREGDLVVEQIVREAARQLGMAAGWLVNLIGPDVILLGGGLVEALPGIYADEVQRAAEAHSMPSFQGTFRVCVANLGDFAAIKGAAAWAHRKVSENVEPVVRRLA